MLWPPSFRETPASRAPGRFAVLGFLVSAVALLVGGCAPLDVTEPAEPRGEVVSVTHDSRSVILGGIERSYTVVVPEFLGTGELFPVLVAVHGAGGNAEQMAEYTGLNAIAQREGFIVVYPEGTMASDVDGEFSWNAGVCCGVPARTGVDDVAFIDTVIQDVVDTSSGDPQRVFVAGFSNGGMLANRLACESSQRLAGIAVVAGALSGGDCGDRQPMPVLLIHGTSDDTVPYAGGATNARISARFGPWVNPSVAEGTEAWRETNGCASGSTSMIDSVVTTVTLDGCAAGTALVLVIIEGGGHTWPTTEASGIDASTLIVEFFGLASRGAPLAG